MMLQKPKSRKTAILKYGLSAPLFLIAMVLSSATISENKTIKQIENQIQPVQPITEILVPKMVENLVIDNKQEEVFFKKQVVNGNIDGEFDALKKHFANTLNYPTEAKHKGLMTKLGIEFKINKGGKIESAKSLSQTDNEFSKEALKSIISFTEKINVEAGNYTYFFVFKLEGSTKKIIDETSYLGIIKNYVGEAIVTGYMPTSLMLNEVVLEGKLSTKDEFVYTNPEVLPSFSGGLEAFGKFLGSNLRYPPYARENDIQGRVYISFVVEKDGGLSDIKISRGIGGGCDEEAVRVLSISPKWMPGIQNGKEVRVSYTVPIFFQLNKKIDINMKSNNIDLQNLTSKIADKKVLLIIDGKEFMGDNKDLNESLKPEDIESVNVIKDETALKAYGDKGKNGVIEITTKKKK